MVGWDPIFLCITSLLIGGIPLLLLRKAYMNPKGSLAVSLWQRIGLLGLVGWGLYYWKVSLIPDEYIGGWLVLVFLLASMPLLLELFGKTLQFGKSGIEIWQKVGVLIITLVGVLLPIPLLTKVFIDIPVSLQQSDIIPQIDVMLRLFFWEGQTPYQTITEFGYPLFSPYMPLHWGPFVVPKLFEMDFRWFAYGVFGLWYVWFAVWLSGLKLEWEYKCVFAALPSYFLYQLVVHMPSIFGHTVETLIMSYYLLLGLSIFARSPYLKAGALILCLLSRYTVLFWVPLYLGFIFLFDQRRKAMIMGALTFLGIILFYIVPFWIQDPSIIWQGLEHHKGVTEKAWTYEGWYNPNGIPAILDWGVGLGIYFFHHAGGDILARLQLLAYLQLGLSISVVIVLGVAYRFLRTNISLELYLLLALKIYLTIFYQLNPLPFVYYLMVPASLTLIVLPALFSRMEGRSG